jgi:hypothetical protein
MPDASAAFLRVLLLVRISAGNVFERRVRGFGRPACGVVWWIPGGRFVAWHLLAAAHRLQPMREISH